MSLSVLSAVQKGRSQRPPRVLIYGTEGIGKSTWAAQAPVPIFVQTEDGIDELGVDRFPLARSFDEVANALDELAREQHDYQTVVVDSLDWLERLIWDHLCREAGAASIEKVDGGYGRGYIHALSLWRQVIDSLTALRDQRNMAVILTAHCKIEKFEDPESVSYDRYSPRLHKHASALLTEWADAVLFATRKIRTQTEDAGFNRKRSIAHALGRDGAERVLKCVGGPSCVAKNRYAIAEELPLSWESFVEAITPVS